VSCGRAAALAPVRSCDDAGDPNNLFLAFWTAVTGVLAIIMILAPSCLNFPTDGDFDCGELSEFLVDMFFRLPSVFSCISDLSLGF
jgi:hypothetical protein